MRNFIYIIKVIDFRCYSIGLSDSPSTAETRLYTNKSLALKNYENMKKYVVRNYVLENHEQKSEYFDKVNSRITWYKDGERQMQVILTMDRCNTNVSL